MPTQPDQVAAPIDQTVLGAAGLVTEAWRHYFRRIGALLSRRPRLFVELPAVPTDGMLVTVSDAMTAGWGDVVAGGGINVVLAFWNGTQWTVAGK